MRKAQLFGLYRDERAVERLERLAGDEIAVVRLEALTSLARVGGMESLPFVVTGLESGDRAVQAAAVRAMAAIAGYGVGSEFESGPGYGDKLDAEIAKWREWWRGEVGS
jgi:hypothetical protein